MITREFLNSVGGLTTRKIVYRPGASYTSSFGLTERHRSGEWGWPGIHIGVDRGPDGIRDPRGIWSPLDFESSHFVDWKGEVYGTMIHLHHEAGFEVCIAHCFPEDIDILPKIENGLGVPAKTFIGLAGSNGIGYGVNPIHTHTEIRSDADSTPVLEDILAMRYGAGADRPLSDRDVIRIYKLSRFTRTWEDFQILEDFERLKREWGIRFINAHKIVRSKGGRVLTYYSSRGTLLF